MKALINKTDNFVCKMSNSVPDLWKKRKELSEIYNIPESNWIIVHDVHPKDVELYQKNVGKPFYLSFR